MNPLAVLAYGAEQALPLTGSGTQLDPDMLPASFCLESLLYARLYFKIYSFISSALLCHAL